MLNDPLWKRALKAVVEIKDPPPPPPPEPIPQAAYDELDGALKIQERREARQRLNPAPVPPAAEESTESPVDADGLVNLETLYRQAGVPIVPHISMRFISPPKTNYRSYCRVKFTVTVMMTGTGTPFNSVGVNCHCFTASSAA